MQRGDYNKTLVQRAASTMSELRFTLAQNMFTVTRVTKVSATRAHSGYI